MKKHTLAKVLLIAAAIFSFSSCKEDIDERNRYTFTGETIADFLLNREDQFSSFTEILKKANLGTNSASNIMALLGTYGHFTCFAPTNEAVERFLIQQDSIYWENVRALEAGEIGLKDFFDTGIHSPLLSELTDSMANEIAKNHLLNRAHLTRDLNEGAFPDANLNDRFLSIAWENDENQNVYAKVNNNARIILADTEVENGVIQVLDEVLSPSTELLPDLLKSQDSFSIYAEALALTGLEDSLRLYRDDSYDLGGKSEQSLFGNYKVPYPETKYYKNTVLVMPNSLLESDFGIKDIDGLIELANKWYGKTYYDVVDEDYRSRNNPLNRFISYHIIDRQLLYASGSGTGGFLMENYKSDYSGFSSEINMPTTHDRYDYFETMMPYTTMKVTKPFTNAELSNEIVLNYAQDNGKRFYNAEMRKHMNVIVMPLSRVIDELGISDFDQNALNGIIHVIDRPIIYNRNEMQGNILNERMRFDYLSFWPELTNNNVRWRQKSAIEQVMIPDGYCKRLRFNTPDGKIAMYCPTGGGPGVYQGDELQVMQNYDFEHRLPYLPEGTYELRYGYQVWSNRGIAQFYVDGKVTGLPIDMNMSTTNPRIGWLADTGEEEVDNENDKAMRNRGFMKAPASIQRFVGESIRDWNMTVRVILSTSHLSEGVDHWVRIKNVQAEYSDKALQLDYFEIVPKSVISNPDKPEDRY
ncbi:MAG: fasciclin domain-containing protein [Bacteroidaceae bacterium]|nr:fasciclin domain-containing protein [Bacteroidaceae bacterium]